jgi:hypothetical protein
MLRSVIAAAKVNKFLIICALGIGFIRDGMERMSSMAVSELITSNLA